MQIIIKTLKYIASKCPRLVLTEEQEGFGTLIYLFLAWIAFSVVHHHAKPYWDHYQDQRSLEAAREAMSTKLVFQETQGEFEVRIYRTPRN